MKKMLAVFGFGLVLMTAGLAQAINIDFEGNDGGLLWFLADGNVQGQNIIIDDLSVFDIPGGDQTDISVENGLLNFNTATGAISITGAIPSLGINSSITLLEGEITDFEVGGTSRLPFVTLFGLDEKADDLEAALGLNIPFPWAFVAFSGGSECRTQNGSKHCIAVSNDVINVPTPEPASLLLLGTGLVGLGLWGRRRMKKNRQ